MGRGGIDAASDARKSVRTGAVPEWRMGRGIDAASGARKSARTGAVPEWHMGLGQMP